MRVIRPSTEDEMIWLFRRGELPSERFGPAIRGAIDERLLLEPDLGDESQNALRRDALTQLRGYGSREGLFHGFPDDMHWEWAALTPDEVLAAHYIEYGYWVELSGGSRLPLDAADRIRAGMTVFRVPNDGLFELADQLGMKQLSELIVLGGDGGRLVVLEGHVRLTAYALRPEALPARCYSAARRGSPSGRSGESAEEAVRRDACGVGGAEERGILRRATAHM